MEKIYSRKRIKIPKINIFQCIILILVIIVVISIVSFILAAYPIFEASCKNRASSIAINVSSEEVNKVMRDYEYEDLIDIQKNEDGSITMIKARIVPINEMISKITSNIKNEIDKKEQVQVGINLGAVTGFSSLSAIGPRFNIKMEASGRSNSQT